MLALQLCTFTTYSAFPKMTWPRMLLFRRIKITKFIEPLWVVYAKTLLILSSIWGGQKLTLNLALNSLKESKDRETLYRNEANSAKISTNDGVFVFQTALKLTSVGVASTNNLLTHFNHSNVLNSNQAFYNAASWQIQIVFCHRQQQSHRKTTRDKKWFEQLGK